MKKIKVLSLFSGIGAFEKALKKVNLEYELVNYCEIDKYASKSYSEIHNVSESMNLWDVTTVDTSKLPNDIDLLTHGSPCQSFSVAGRQDGGDKGSGTRSSLMWETVRIISDIKPKVIVWENVKNVLSKKHKHNFDAYIDELNELNYNSYHKVLNAKDFKIPQNRERIFVISIRKDIDNSKFAFPEGFLLDLRLKDMLDDEVEERYYIKKTLNIVPKDKYLQWDNSGKGYNSQQNRGYYQDGLCPTLSCCNNNGDKSQVVLADKAEIIRVDIPQTVKVRKFEVDTKKLVETLRENKSKSQLTNKVIAKRLDVPITKVEHWFRQDDCFAIPDENIWLDLKAMLGIETDEFDESIMTFEEKEGVYEKSERHYFADGIAPTLYDKYAPTLRINCGSLKVADKPLLVGGFGEKNFGKQYRQGNRVYDSNAISMALNASPVGNAGGYSYLYQLDNLRIRKLTPNECFRLMGFDDIDYEKAAKVNSRTQLYKQAGNSIVVNVLEAIFDKLKVYFIDDNNK